MTKNVIRFGIIGGGLMGKEFASAAARWMHLNDVDFHPVIHAVASRTEQSTRWFDDNVPTVKYTSTNYKNLLQDPDIDAIYCAVPHNLHADMYTDIIEHGKHLLGEKPFGIDLEANRRINTAIEERTDIFARSVSQFSYYPGAYQIYQWLLEERFGRIIDVEIGFLHCSDLNPQKPINWKRKIDINGEYGALGDLGPHVLHIPLRMGWMPFNLRSLLSNIITERPDGNGKTVPCETWDNATLATEVKTGDQQFPMVIEAKRIAPGHTNTWYINIHGTEFSAEYTTQNPKIVRYLPYSPGDDQSWRTLDIGFSSVYPTITGGIFEFGMPDALLQMFAAFCDELTHGRTGDQKLYCPTPAEANQVHKIFTAALESQKSGNTVLLRDIG